MVPGAASSIRRFCPQDTARFAHRFKTLLIGLWVLCGFFPQTAKAQQHAARGTSPAHLVWDTPSTGPTRFVAVHGRRASILGYSNSGLEMWAYPVQILKAYGVSFRPADTTTEVDGLTILRRITYSPESVTRTYVGSDFIVREKLFVPLDEPGAIISYDVESNRPLDIVVRFASVLDLMWPASLGGQEINWDAASSSYVLSEPTRRFTAAIGESTSHQLWSSAMAVSPAIRGLFGLEWNADRNTIRVTPSLPADWNEAELHHVPLGNTFVDLAMRRVGTTLEVSPTGPGAATLHLESGAPGSKTAAGVLRIPLTTVEVCIPHGLPEPGSTTHQLKVLDQRASARSLMLRLAAPANSRQNLFLRINDIKANVPSNDVDVSASHEQLRRIQISFPQGTGYVDKTVTLSW